MENSRMELGLLKSKFEKNWNRTYCTKICDAASVVAVRESFLTFLVCWECLSPPQFEKWMRCLYDALEINHKEMTHTELLGTQEV